MESAHAYKMSATTTSKDTMFRTKASKCGKADLLIWVIILEKLIELSQVTQN